MCVVLCVCVCVCIHATLHVRVCIVYVAAMPVCVMCTLVVLLGDLKLVEKPQPCILGPYDFTNIKVVISVLNLMS